MIDNLQHKSQLRPRILTTIVLGALCLFSCNEPTKVKPAPVTPPTANFRIIGKIAHDANAFTQGLEYFNGNLIEGTGQTGTSWISTLNPQNLKYEKRALLPREYFGEGITVLNGKIYQLTYKKKKCFIYDATTFKQLEIRDYPFGIKEGWGLTNNGSQLIMSDGTNYIYTLNPADLSIVKKIQVKQMGQNVLNLNELEYYKGALYANVWQRNVIKKIDPNTGNVVDEYNLSNIVNMEVSNGKKIDVLNGIAIDPKTGHMLVTGKFWSNFYKLELQ